MLTHVFKPRLLVVVLITSSGKPESFYQINLRSYFLLTKCYLQFSALSEIKFSFFKFNVAVIKENITHFMFDIKK